MESEKDPVLPGKTAPAERRVGWAAGQIPNIITLINLFFGCCAVLNVFLGYYVAVFWFFAAAILADYLDGAAARLLGVHSPLGKELDSLADMVSFGVLPGSIFYVLLLDALTGSPGMLSFHWGATPAFLVTLFSALRLAKFNLDVRQADYFIGLPTPSSCLFSVGLLLVYHFDRFHLSAFWVTPMVLYLCLLLLSALLIAELPMFNLKFKRLAWTGNEIKIIFAAVAVVLLIVLREAALSLIIVLYVLLSLLFKLLKMPV